MIVVEVTYEQGAKVEVLVRADPSDVSPGERTFAASLIAGVLVESGDQERIRADEHLRETMNRVRGPAAEPDAEGGE